MPASGHPKPRRLEYLSGLRTSEQEETMANVRDFGAKGDGATDDTAALRQAIEQAGGELYFPRGDYLIRQPLTLPLAQHGRRAGTGQGGTARLIMEGAGPALHLVGTHHKSAKPQDVAEEVWRKERLPTVHGLEIVGASA